MAGLSAPRAQEHTDIGRLPDFIAVGPPRTASTWLHEVLGGRVGLPKDVKETKFFDQYYTSGLLWYADHFRHCAAGVPMGEIGASYFGSIEARARIHHDLPECRIICSLRDPVERLYSYYRVRRRFFVGSFEENLNTNAEFLDLKYCRYAFHLSEWWKLFGRDRVLVLFYDDLVADAQNFIDQVCDFIGIARFSLAGSPVGNRKVHSVPRAPRNQQLARAASIAATWLKERRHYRTLNFWQKTALWDLCFSGGEEYQPLDHALEARLRESFRPEIEELEKLVGRDLSAWK